MILYMARRLSYEIVPVEGFERMTKNFAVKENGKREPLVTSFYGFYRSEQEAIEAKLAQLRCEVMDAKRRLERAEFDTRVFLEKYGDRVQAATPSE